jgi:hypothetical protein
MINTLGARMNAQAARELADQYVDPKLEQVLRNIAAEARSGGYSLCHYESLGDRTIAALKNLGYNVVSIQDWTDTTWKISW